MHINGGHINGGHINGGDITRLAVAWFVSFLALLLTEKILPGFTAQSRGPIVVAAAVTGVVGMLVRPVLVQVAAAIGWVGVVLATIFGQAIVMQVAMDVVPGVTFDSFGDAVAAAWISAAFGTLIAWLLSAGTDESFALALLRIRPGEIDDPEIDGVLFIQLDGASFPVMTWALNSGSMPTLRRLLASQSHALHEWTVQLPCTTPASQQAILMGTADGVPAFRWYDRELGRVLVSNRPPDTAIIEARASTGLGLLADGGISISNLFTGDAPRAAMTMSRLEVTRGARRTRVIFARFLLRPDGLARSLWRTIVEAGRERFQAKQQRRLDIVPRVHRSWTFAGLRAFSNGILRDLNTAIVSEEIMRGTRSIYVDYVDYDEVAHHAGATRLESLASLTALDHVVGVLSRVIERAPRRYHIILLSDHGQSTGEILSSRYGQELSEVCADLTQVPTTGVESSVEGWGRVDSVLEDLGESGVSQAVSRKVDQRMAPDDHQGSELIVLAGGNLALVYVPGPQRLMLEEIEARWPALVPGLVRHPGVGFVSAMSADGPVAIGPTGRHLLATGVVEGTDPLTPFGDHAAAMLLTATSMDRAPELYVNSLIDPDTLEVAAFEPLVGSHGGLGGWQDRGFVMAPLHLIDPEEPIIGGDALHRLLVGSLEKLGHRSGLTRTEDASR